MPHFRQIARLLVVGSALFLSAPDAATARGMEAGRAAAAGPYAAYTNEAAQRFRIPSTWIEAVLRAESAGDVRAVSPVGAMGLMQVMPDTWADLRARYGLGPDPFEPRDNIFAGAAHLREMFDHYGNVSAMLAAYNAGPDRTDDYLSFGRPLPAETRAYVATIAPALGAAPLPDAGLPGAGVTDWREAPLFVARGPGASNDAPMPGADATSAALVAAGGDADAPEIFVPRSLGGSRR